MKLRFWLCRNCGHEEVVTDNDIAELHPYVAASGAIKVSCPNCGAYTVSKPFDDTFQGGVFEVVRPHIRRGVNMANKKFNPASAMLAFEALCKDMLINNMVQMLQTAEVEDDIIDSVLNLKSLSSKEVMEAVSIVQQVAVSTMVARNLEKAKQQEDERRRQDEKVEGLFNLGKHYS